MTNDVQDGFVEKFTSGTHFSQCETHQTDFWLDVFWALKTEDFLVYSLSAEPKTSVFFGDTS